jgi:hypothetical protein
MNFLINTIDIINMNIFEIIPNEQTPKVQEIADIALYLKMHGPYLQEFVSIIWFNK